MTTLFIRHLVTAFELAIDINLYPVFRVKILENPSINWLIQCSSVSMATTDYKNTHLDSKTVFVHSKYGSFAVKIKFHI